MTTSTTTKQDKVLAVLSEGRTLSSAQMRAFFGIGNPQAVIQVSIAKPKKVLRGLFFMVNTIAG